MHVMSRLDSFIARMQAQRDCLNFLEARRRRRCPARSSRSASATAAPTIICASSFPAATSTSSSARSRPIPTASRPTTGCSWARRARRSPQAAQQLGATAALIHTDLGTGDHAANMAMGQWLGPALDALAAIGRLRPRQPGARRRALAAPARAAGRAEGPVLPLSRSSLAAADQPQQHQQHDRRRGPSR